MECVFCEIANGGVPADIVYQDEKIVAFRDLNPQAPVHVLIIPARHIDSLDGIDGSAEQKELLGHLLSKVHEIAALLGLENGYRLVTNCGEDGLQTVEHLHFHLLGRRQMGWPPG